MKCEMYFIGVISDNKKFQNLQKIIKNNSDRKEYTLININKNSISNLKNIKFEMIIFLEILNNVGDFDSGLNEIFQDIKYFIVNSDLKFDKDLSNIEANIITFGLNHFSTVTLSSITDYKIWFSIQRNFKNKYGRIVEVGEYSIEIDKDYSTFLYELLVFFIIYIINDGKT